MAQEIKPPVCSWCSDVLKHSSGRVCLRCGKVTCQRSGCGVFTDPEITGENQVWICQRCVADALSNLMSSASELGAAGEDEAGN